MNAIATASRAIPIARGLPLLLSQSEDPHADLMALVWGPRFDREHAISMLARRAADAPVQLPTLLAGVMAAAEGFDALSERQQRRLRSIIRRHQARIDSGARSGCDNAPCLASS